jgi:hypothetical protein
MRRSSAAPLLRHSRSRRSTPTTRPAATAQAAGMAAWADALLRVCSGGGEAAPPLGSTSAPVQAPAAPQRRAWRPDEYIWDPSALVRAAMRVSGRVRAGTGAGYAFVQHGGPARRTAAHAADGVRARTRAALTCGAHARRRWQRARRPGRRSARCSRASSWTWSSAVHKRRATRWKCCSRAPPGRTRCGGGAPEAPAARCAVAGPAPSRWHAALKRLLQERLC